MLQFINDLPPHVVGIHAIGDVTKEDFDKVLKPRLDELAERQGEINYLLVLETEVKNFTLGAWWEDLKVGLKHFTKWNKVAVVTDQKGVEWLSDALRFFIPGQSKGFSLDLLDQAVSWVSNAADEDKQTNQSAMKQDNNQNTPQSSNNEDENAKHAQPEKGATQTEQNKADDMRVETVTPDNDNGEPGKPAGQASSNKGQGPAGENL